MRASVPCILTVIAASIAAAWPASFAISQSASTRAAAKFGAAAEPTITHFIVKFRDGKTAVVNAGASSSRVSALSARAGARLGFVRTMALGATVLRADAPMKLKAAEAMAQRIAEDASVEWAVPDLPVRRFATPMDANFATRQWNLQAPTTTINSPVAGGGTRAFTTTGGANLPTAWDRTTGSASVVVAVVDSGVTLTQPDLAPALLPGYDFVSSAANFGVPMGFIENDGPTQAGRDNDPTDPGDWVTAVEKTTYSACNDGNTGDTPSSWHGTHMAGIIAAQWGNTPTVNGTSTAGIAPGAKILPVRALGKCGGISSDVIDAIAWAAGIPSPIGGTLPPPPPAPAQIINLSLGSSTGACNMAYRNLITELTARNVVVVVATGNDGAPAITQRPIAPASFAVTSHIVNGDNADYANVGPEVAISAPGGGDPTSLAITPAISGNDSAYFIWSTYLFGATTPTSTATGSTNAGPAIGGLTGTSPATPHVSGAVALIRSLYPQATITQVRSYLRASARPHPQGGYCNRTSGPSNLFRCGPGLLDVADALTLASQKTPGVSLGNAKVVAPNDMVTVQGTVSIDAARSLGNATWSQVSGPAVTRTDNVANNSTSFQAPATGTVVLNWRSLTTRTRSAAMSRSSVSTRRRHRPRRPTRASPQGRRCS